MIVTLRSYLGSIILFTAMIIPAEAVFGGGKARTDSHSYKLEYHVKRDGATIGTYRFNVHRDEQGQRFDAKLDIEVTIFGFTAYELRHRRSEQWRNGQLVKLEGKSVYNDDERYKIRLSRQGGQHYTLRVNGKTEKLDGTVVSFSPRLSGDWQKARLISLKGNADAVTKHKRGTERLTIGGKTYDAGHYRLKGDVVRDLWYDDKGRLLKLSYTKDGATIKFVRKAVIPGE